MSYNSKYTGQEVEGLLDQAGTALQPTDVSEVATSGSYNDLSDKPTIPDISGKQDELVSGTNIKTINGNSILGSGDLKIDSSIPVVEVRGSATLQPNTLTIVTSLDPASQRFTLATPTDDSIYNEYMVQFDAISSLGEDVALPSFEFPAGVIWVEEPVFEKNYRYQISIVNNVGLIVGVPLENDSSNYGPQ